MDTNSLLDEKAEGTNRTEQQVQKKNKELGKEKKEVITNASPIGPQQCAFLQSQEAGEKYLLLLREALMLHGKNIAKENVLIEIAVELSKERPCHFDVIKSTKDMKNDNGLEAFRKDLQEIQYKNIKRFPTMIIKSEHAQGVVVTGFRPYSVFLEALMQIAMAPTKETRK